MELEASQTRNVQSFLERDAMVSQISRRRAPVNGLFRGPDAPEPLAVPMKVRGRGKPTTFCRGYLTSTRISPLGRKDDSPSRGTVVLIRKGRVSNCRVTTKPVSDEEVREAVRFVKSKMADPAEFNRWANELLDRAHDVERRRPRR